MTNTSSRRTLQVSTLILLLFISMLSGCCCGGDCTCKIPKAHVVKEQNSSIKKVSLVLENSASMEPYYRSSEFQTNLSNLIPTLVEISAKQDFLLSNNTADLQRFAGTPDDAIKKIKSGFQTGGDSPLDQVLLNLIDKAAKEKSVMILVTDLIIDDPSLDFKDELSTLQARIKTKFLEAQKNDLGAIIYRFEAKYAGKYFTSKRNVAYDIDQVRPYFFWVIGPKDMVNNFGVKIESKWDKLKYDAVYTGLKPEIAAPYMLTYSLARGCTVKMEYTKDSSKVLGYSVKQIEDSIHFCLALNLSDVPKGIKSANSGIKDMLSVKSDIAKVKLDYFDQSTILKNRDISTKEKGCITEFKHFFLVKVSNIDKSNKYSINLVPTLNSINNFGTFSTDDDTEKDELSNKTFGLTQFVTGMLEAYESGNNQILATIKIN